MSGTEPASVRPITSTSGDIAREVLVGPRNGLGHHSSERLSSSATQQESK